MSAATWHPKSGQWGFMGTAGGSQARNVRDFLWEHDDKAYKAPETMGTTDYIGTSGKDIPGLGKMSHRQAPSGGDSDKVTAGKLKKSWYNPYTKFAVKDPLKQMKKVEASGTAATSETGEWTRSQMTEQEAATAGVSGITAADRMLPLAGDVDYLLQDAAIKRKEGEDTYTTRMEEFDQQEKESKESYMTGTQDIASARKQAAQAASTEYQAAEIEQGATGMAYSAPAEGGFEMDESTMSMQDISGSERDLRGQQLKDRRLLKKGRGEAEGDYEVSERDYFDNVSAAYDAADTALQDTYDKLTGIMQQHEVTTPAAFKAGEITGLKGMFSESQSDFGDYGTSMDYYTKASDFATKARDAARTSKLNVGE